MQTYDPMTIRKSAMALAHRTEAAALFEKGLDAELVMPTILDAIDLMRQLTGAVVAGAAGMRGLVAEIIQNVFAAAAVGVDVTLHQVKFSEFALVFFFERGKIDGQIVRFDAFLYPHLRAAKRRRVVSQTGLG